MAAERTRDTIDRIAEASKPLLDAARPYAERAAEAAKPVIERARPLVERANERAKPFIERANERARPFVERANERAQPVFERAKPAVEPLVDNARRIAERIGTSPAVTEVREQVREVIPRTAPPRSAGEAATPAPGTAYEQWTRAQLYERAQELGVEGRSQMSKDELVEALRTRS